ncbi:phenylacetate--CoA ligase family protein [Niallia sp. 03133]|uniref:phenylacetate--CoA ligase family protein n=1 Tax=Niallia sp. 03133 TaxID=3458060 RepID=UPI004043CA17
MVVSANNLPRKIVLNIDEDKQYLKPLVAYYDQLEAKEKTFDRLMRAEIEDYQLQMVNMVLKHVWDKNEFYRQMLEDHGFMEPVIHTIDELSKVPFLTKDMIRGDRNKLLCVEPNEIGQVHVTSGTTGEPIYTSFTLNDQYLYELYPKYPHLFPEDEHDVIAVALPYEFALPGLGFQRLYQFAFGSTILSIGKGGYMGPVDKSLALMKEFKATILATTPSYAALLAEESENLGIDIKKDIQLKRIIITGEGCSFTYRQRLQELWGCEVSFFYGSTECGVIGVECSEHTGYHVTQGHVKVEIIDPDGKENLGYNMLGEIVVTTLNREGMPMLRYRTGDIGFMKVSNCSCGCEMDILHLMGRQENQIMIGNELFSPFYIENVLLGVKEVGLWYHILVHHTNSITLEIESLSAECSEEELSRKVLMKMKKVFPINFAVVVKARIPRTFGKANRVFFEA